MLTKLFLLTILAVLPVRVSTTGGNSIEGDFIGVGNSELLLAVQGSEETFPFSELAVLEPTEAPSGRPPVPRVMLASGSVIAAEEVSLSDERLTIQPRRQAILKLPIAQVRSVRFKSATAKLDPIWFAKMEEDRRGDTLVIQRDDGRLDFVDGLVTSISTDDKIVKFDIDGDIIEAPIARLEGILFGGNKPVTRPSDIQILDVYASRWSVSRLEPSEPGEPLKLILSNSLQHRLPLEHVESIRWSGGLSLLASMKPAEKSYSPSIQTNLSSTLLNSWFSPQADAGQDLIFVGNSSAEYRIEDGFTTFAAGIRRDDQVTQATKTILRIRIDEKVVWEQTLERDAAYAVELPISGGKRLTIEVDCANDSELGDTIRILRPRLLRQ